MRIRSWLIAAVCLAGCHLDVSFEDSHFYCGGGGSCPTDQTCVEDYCQAPVPAADAAVPVDDAAPTPDAVPGAPDAHVSATADAATPPPPPDAAVPHPDAAPPPPPDAAPPPVCTLGHVADNFA